MRQERGPFVNGATGDTTRWLVVSRLPFLAFSGCRIESISFQPICSFFILELVYSAGELKMPRSF